MAAPPAAAANFQNLAPLIRFLLRIRWPATSPSCDSRGPFLREQAGECDRDHERGPVEDLLGPRGRAEQLQAGDSGHQQIKRDRRSPGVESTGLDGRGTKKRGRKGGK